MAHTHGINESGSQSQKLKIVICISCIFFLVEIAVGFYTNSLSIIADAFHYLNDLIGFAVALTACEFAERKRAPAALSFGWQRATLLGAFFNGVFLLALGISIFLQAMERFVSLHHVEKPLLLVIVGCAGFALNMASVSILHDHGHSTTKTKGLSREDMPPAPLAAVDQYRQRHLEHRHGLAGRVRIKQEGRNLGLTGVLLHILGDAANNIGVVIAGTVIWKTETVGKYYIDPGISVLMSLMILLSAIPLVRKSGFILLESLPSDINVDDVKHDMEKIQGILAVHELHVWRLNQEKTLASAHIVVSRAGMADFPSIASTVVECFHAYGVHSVTLQPELQQVASSSVAANCDDDEAIQAAGIGGANISIDSNNGAAETAHMVLPGSVDTPATNGRRIDAPLVPDRASVVPNNGCQMRCRTSSCRELACCE